ncbi:hyalin-like isoform X2 [Anneissia japonica]|uniref:hyalin-like isoform X2 n=1 Tax=Anneissia japonica TaxID=1529436 RepID=UPI00142570E9|nr:hyalin-like isoform X2 [Anneissia japonica]
MDCSMIVLLFISLVLQESFSQYIDATCNGITTQVSVYTDVRVSSIGYPSSYYNNMDVSCTFHPCSQCGLRLEFTDFQLESGYDYLQIYYSGQVQGWYTGYNSPPDYVMPAGNTLVIRMTTDYSVVRRGFRAIITAIDEIRPSASCPSTVDGFTNQGDSNGVVTFRISASDNSGIVDFVANYTSVTPGGGSAETINTLQYSSNVVATCPIGSTHVMFTFRDARNNQAYCHVKIVIQDNEDPIIGCDVNILSWNLIETMDGVVYVSTDNGSPNATVSWSFPVVSDNSGGAVNITSRPYRSGDILPLSEHPIPIEFMATDPYGNSNTCTLLIKVRDTEDPVIFCPRSVEGATASGRSSGSIQYNVLASDNVQISTIYSNFSMISRNVNMPYLNLEVSEDFPIGSTTVMYNVSDNADPLANTAVCFIEINIEDEEDPFISCNINITSRNLIEITRDVFYVSTDNGSPNATVSWSPPLATDNSGEVVEVISRPYRSGDILPISEIPICIEFIATDSSGNLNMCTVFIRVLDTEDPVIYCPRSIEGTTASGSSSGSIQYNILASDNVQISTIYSNFSMLSRDVNMPYLHLEVSEDFPIGSTTVMYRVSDNADPLANTAVCFIEIKIEDEEVPFISCNINITSRNLIKKTGDVFYISTDDGSPNATVFWSSPFVIDNSGEGIEMISRPYISGDILPISEIPIPIEFIATDPSGNSNTCTTFISVQDTEDPVIICPSTIEGATASGRSSGTIQYNVLVSDNVQISTIYSNFSIVSRDVNMSYLNLEVSEEFPIGSTTVMYSVSDNADPLANTAVCFIEIKIKDEEVPFISCNINITSKNLIETTGDVFYISTDNGSPNATVSWSSPFVSDNSGEVVEMISRPYISGDILLISKIPIPIEFIATDFSGNSNTCTIFITVRDEQDPFISCNLTITSWNVIEKTGGIFYISTDSGSPNATVSWSSPIASDNSDEDVEVTSYPYVSGDMLPISESPIDVEFMAKDSSGNTNTCSVLIMVRDTESPEVLCPRTVNGSTDDGKYFGAIQYNITASDNVQISSIYSSHSTIPIDVYSPFTYLEVYDDFPIGERNVTYIFYDDANNVANCSIVVSINDDEVPFISCQISITSWNLIETTGGIFYVSTDSGSPNATLSWTSPVTSDNSGGVVKVTSSPYRSGDILPLSENPYLIEFMATDPSGNANACSVLIMVRDTEAPVIWCPTSIEGFTRNGLPTGVIQYNITASDNDQISAVYSDISTVSHDVQASFINLGVSDSYSIGNTTVIYTFLDRAIPQPNIGTCSITVTVYDIEDPSISCDINITSANLVEVKDGIFYVSTDIGSTNATVSWSSPIVSDNSDANIQVISRPYISGDILPISESPIVIELMAKDPFENSNTCTILIQVLDIEAPVAWCPAYITGVTDEGRSTGVIQYNITASDNVQISTIYSNYSNKSLDVSSSFVNLELSEVFPIGSTIVTYTFADSRTPLTNATTCSIQIVVEDKEPPFISCLTITITSGNLVEYDNSGIMFLRTDVRSSTAVVTWVLPVVTDNSNDLIHLTSSPYESGDSLPISDSPIVITFSAVDQSQNNNSCFIRIQIQDEEPPTVRCPISLIGFTDRGQPFGTLQYNVSASDNVGLSYVQWHNALKASENDSCVLNLTYAELEVIEEFPIGLTLVTYKFADNASPINNIAVCTVWITIEDIEKPAISCPTTLFSRGYVIQESGVFNILARTSFSSSEVTWSSPIVTDNSGGLINVISNPYQSGDMIDISIDPITITFKATDDSGNVGTCTILVHVQGINGCECGPCLNGGDCFYNRLANDATCHCQEGWKGDFCQDKIPRATIIEGLQQNITLDNVNERLSKLDDITRANVNLTNTEMLAVYETLHVVSTMGVTTNLTSEQFFGVVDNLLDIIEENKDVSMSGNESMLLMMAIEEQIKTTAGSTYNFYRNSEYISTATVTLNKSNLTDITCAVTKTREIVLISDCLKNRCMDNESIKESITLPLQTTNKITTNVDVSFIVYHNDYLFPSKSTRSTSRKTTGTILAASVYEEEANDFAKPVQLMFTSLSNTNISSSKCVFWDTADSDWSSRGCWYAGKDDVGKVKCHCTHLSSFAVLMSPNMPGVATVYRTMASRVTTYIACSLAIIILLFAIIAMLRGWMSRNDRSLWTTQCLCLSNILVYVCVACSIDAFEPGSGGCTVVAVSLHYILLACNMWVAMELLVDIKHTGVTFEDAKVTSGFFLILFILGWGMYIS